MEKAEVSAEQIERVSQMEAALVRLNDAIATVEDALDTYEQMFGKAPVVATIHAGLECGLLSGQLPELDCVSFGPNMFDVHSVNEKLEVASVQRMWDYLLAVLKKL